MDTTSPSNQDVGEAFRAFPFTTDQEYQVGGFCGSRPQCADDLPPFSTQ